MNLLFSLLIVVLGSGCAYIPVDVPTAAVPGRGAAGEIAGPDPGAGIPVRTLNFIVEAYGNTTQRKAEIVEKIYAEVMNRTALYSFKPKDNYRVVIYQSRVEYQDKTGQPEWSGGMKTGRGVYTFDQPGVDVVLAHEITHLIFGEFLGKPGEELRWLNEGLAMVIEARFLENMSYAERSERWNTILQQDDIVLTMDEIVAFRPYSEETRDVNKWYNTVASLTGFLVDTGGAFNFSLFLRGIRDGASVNDALRNAYPGKYSTLGELYTLWRAAL